MNNCRADLNLTDPGIERCSLGPPLSEFELSMKRAVQLANEITGAPKSCDLACEEIQVFKAAPWAEESMAAAAARAAAWVTDEQLKKNAIIKRCLDDMLAASAPKTAAKRMLEAAAPILTAPPGRPGSYYVVSKDASCMEQRAMEERVAPGAVTPSNTPQGIVTPKPCHPENWGSGSPRWSLGSPPLERPPLGSPGATLTVDPGATTLVFKRPAPFLRYLSSKVERSRRWAPPEGYRPL